MEEYVCADMLSKCEWSYCSVRGANSSHGPLNDDALQEHL